MKEKHPWALSFCVQALAMGMLGAMAALSGLVLSGRVLAAVHSACIWPLQSALGLYTGFCSAKRGVPAILAWPAAPACFAAVYWAIVGMAPSIGAAALCALASVVGASAGEVLLKRSKK